LDIKIRKTFNGGFIRLVVDIDKSQQIAELCKQHPVPFRDLYPGSESGTEVDLPGFIGGIIFTILPVIFCFKQ
jgi:hypothetical protein